MSNESIKGNGPEGIRAGGAACRQCRAAHAAGLAAPAGNPITSNLYGDGETASLPAEAIAASLGCGNPTALAELKPGETVLDLGSGGGIDVISRRAELGRRAKPTGWT